MEGFKVCANGHYFQDHLDECPYCPKPAATTDRTKIEEPGSDIAGDKTRIFGGGNEADLNKTRIFQDGPNAGEAGFSSDPLHQGRKLTGWLVSYTIDPNGADFRLYEGRNILGSDAACDIVISGDHTVSGRHLTILYRLGVFKYKDELSTNGTFVNDNFSEEGTLNDGDMIRVGNTLFRFRVAL